MLFGSQANNSAHEFSDYDILILLNRDYSKLEEDTILDICYKIDLKYVITQVSGFIMSAESGLEVAIVQSCKAYSTQPRMGRNTLTMGVAHRRKQESG